MEGEKIEFEHLNDDFPILYSSAGVPSDIVKHCKQWVWLALVAV